MVQLAIRGHRTRSEEIIEILEMLGGKNKYQVTAIRETCVYFVDGGIINLLKINQLLPKQFIVFTLKEFLEEFPYKIGDKVYYNNKVCSIIEMLWNSNLNTISYGVYDDKIKNLAIVKELQPYKEETIGRKIESFEILENYCADEVKIEFDPSKFKMVEKENSYYVVKKQPKYPETYEECCEILEFFWTKTLIHGYKGDVLANLQKLFFCRDAYWKIAGDWKPDWRNHNQKKYCIYYCNGNIQRGVMYNANAILAFPTKEMRDAFYENFKELIEACKELL